MSYFSCSLDNLWPEPKPPVPRSGTDGKVPTYTGSDGKEYVVGFRPFSDEVIEDARQPLIMAYYNSMIEQALGLRAQREDWEPVVEPIDLVQTVTMTAPAYEKALRCARLAAQGRSMTPELSFHLLKPNGSLDDKITDVMVSHDQTVNPVRCETSAAGNLASLEEAWAAGMEYAGWSHSHGAHHTFHSPTDDENIKSLMRDSAMRRQISLDGCTFTLYHVPSVVINVMDDDPYVSIAFEYKRLGERDFTFHHRRDAGFRLVDGPLLEIDDDALRRAIDERVTFQGGVRLMRRKHRRPRRTGNLSVPHSLDYLDNLGHAGANSPFIRWLYGSP